MRVLDLLLHRVSDRADPDRCWIPAHYQATLGDGRRVRRQAEHFAGDGG